MSVVCCSFYRLAIVPILLLCLSGSTIIGMGVTFMVGAINFILAVGQK